MRILLVTQWFDPEPTLKGLAFAKALAARGHEVEVLTGFPNYPEGKLYPGYRMRLSQRESVEGISVLRVPLYPSHDTSSRRRFTNYASFALSAATLGTMLSQRADVAYIYHPPATVALPAFVLKGLRHLPFIYDIQDLWPDTLLATGMFSHRLGISLLHRWCLATYRSASRIAVLSPGFKEILCQRGVPAEKIEVIYNWCPEGTEDAAGAHAFASVGDSDRKFRILFAGNLGKAQALDAVLKAAGKLALTAPQIEFVFVGGGVEAAHLQRLTAEMRLPNVRYLSWRPGAEVAVLLQQANALLVHLQDDPLFRITIPSKIQTYLAAGRPILAGVSGDAADLVTRAGAGIVCQPCDPSSIAGAALQLLHMSSAELQAMGENGRRFYQQELSMSVGVEKFERLLIEAAGQRRAVVPAA